MVDAVPWRTVWITGASTGIGREVALKLAKAGATVAVSARSEDKLAELATLSPRIKPYPLDVTDPAATQSVHDTIVADIGPLDLVILNAGVWRPMSAENFDLKDALHSVNVNYNGVLTGLAPTMKAMLARKTGHIAVVASVAGYRGLPKASAYGPTKAALNNLAESLAPELGLNGVTLSVINPGFVKTPMTAVNDFPMPFIIDVDDASERIIRGLAARRFEVVFPTRMAISMKILKHLPTFLFLRATRRVVARDMREEAEKKKQS